MYFRENVENKHKMVAFHDSDRKMTNRIIALKR